MDSGGLLLADGFLAYGPTSLTMPSAKGSLVPFTSTKKVATDSQEAIGAARALVQERRVGEKGNRWVPQKIPLFDQLTASCSFALCGISVALTLHHIIMTLLCHQTKNETNVRSQALQAHNQTSDL
jgi:hypothetical protein